MTTLTQTQKDDFAIGLAVLNVLSVEGMSREDMISKGDEILGNIVQTTETFADFTRAHGKPSDSRTTPFGHEIHVWNNVQFRKGSLRGSLFLMEFSGVSASMYTGG